MIPLIPILIPQNLTFILYIKRPVIFVKIPFKKKIKRKQCLLTNNSKREQIDIRPTKAIKRYKFQ